MRPRDAVPLVALGLILGLTAALWALALWPLPSQAPLWLARTRAVCFGSTSSGLPDASGWIVLTVQPGIMLSILFAGWRRSILEAVRLTARGTHGRTALATVGAAMAIGLGAAGWRVAAASDRRVSPPGENPVPTTYPRLDRPAPGLGLVDQAGRTISLDQFGGRPVLITFAYAHCQTVCPVIVHDVLEVRRRPVAPQPAVLIVTLDPERDVPSRLPAIAREWGLGTEELVLSGSVDAVNRVLDGWKVPRVRNQRTGEVTHPRLVYLVDQAGRLAYATTGGVQAIATLLDRL